MQSYPTSPNDLLPVPAFGDAVFAAESEINTFTFTSHWIRQNIMWKVEWHTSHVT